MESHNVCQYCREYTHGLEQPHGHWECRARHHVARKMAQKAVRYASQGNDADVDWTDVEAWLKQVLMDAQTRRFHGLCHRQDPHSVLGKRLSDHERHKLNQFVQRREMSDRVAAEMSAYWVGIRMVYRTRSFPLQRWLDYLETAPLTAWWTGGL